MHTQGFHHPRLNLAEIISSDGSPKGRMLTMRRWPFEPGQCILTLAGNDDRGFGTLCGSPVPQLNEDKYVPVRLYIQRAGIMPNPTMVMLLRHFSSSHFAHGILARGFWLGWKSGARIRIN